jgi:coenzyme F420-reducing hydrogenase alpha subunit
MVAGFHAPEFSREPKLVSLRHDSEYPYSNGRIVSSDGLDLAIDRWDDAFEERHVEYSNALHARTKDGDVYLLGPAARITLAGDRLHPIAAAALAETGLRDAIRTNIYWSIAARAIELLHALAEAIDIVDGYRPPAEPKVAWTPRPGRGAWATEAPRGLLFHRYEVDERGLVSAAQIVPPTSQNQGAIEQDLALFVPSVLSLSHAEATLRLEQLIRSYDPCISCATHFLDLTIDRE